MIIMRMTMMKSRSMRTMTVRMIKRAARRRRRMIIKGDKDDEDGDNVDKHLRWPRLQR